jgi:hypothetical protein
MRLDPHWLPQPLLPFIIRTGLLLLVAVEGLAQTAKQGDASADLTPNAFHSPMILDTMFAPADNSLWVGEDWVPANPVPWKGGYFTTVEYQRLNKFSCDGMTIQGNDYNPIFHRPPNPQWRSGLAMKVKPRGSDVEVRVRIQLTNPKHNHDKQVMLRLDVLNGDEVVASATMRNNIEEGNANEHTTTFLVPAAKIPGSRMRITMTTENY